MRDNEVLFYDLLGLMTPKQIDGLSVIGGAGNRVPLIELMEEYCTSYKAKILPFKSQIKNQTEEILGEQQVVNGQANSCCVDDFKKSDSNSDSENNNDSESANDDSNQEKQASEKKFQNIEYVDFSKDKNTKVATTHFILQERERSLKSQRELKSREIIHLYQKNSEVSIEEERSLRKDLSRSKNIGNLINKKHM